MQLVFMITARCNASCTHCSTSCGPERDESLSRDTLFRVMQEAAALAQGEPLEFSITGGEPFLDFELLRAVIAHGTELGAIMSCVTNASWASSPAKARELLQTVKDDGLRLLAISTSRFHQQFIKVKRVETALAAARDTGIECVLKFVHGRSDALDPEQVTSWARGAGAQHVELLPLMPSLRAGATVPEPEYARAPGLPQGACPGAIINIAESGEAYTCCTPGAITDFLSLGNVHELPLERIRDRFYLNGRQQILRGRGPAFFAEKVQARGHGDRLRASYGSVCDLCTHIATDPVMRGIADECARTFERNQFEDILGRTAGRVSAT